MNPRSSKLATSHSRDASARRTSPPRLQFACASLSCDTSGSATGVQVTRSSHVLCRLQTDQRSLPCQWGIGVLLACASGSADHSLYRCSCCFSSKKEETNQRNLVHFSNVKVTRSRTSAALLPPPAHSPSFFPVRAASHRAVAGPRDQGVALQRHGPRHGAGQRAAAADARLLGPQNRAKGCVRTERNCARALIALIALPRSLIRACLQASFTSGWRARATPTWTSSWASAKTAGRSTRVPAAATSTWATSLASRSTSAKCAPCSNSTSTDKRCVLLLACLRAQGLAPAPNALSLFGLQLEGATIRDVKGDVYPAVSGPFARCVVCSVVR